MKCFLCSNDATRVVPLGHTTQVTCERCGEYRVTDSLAATLEKGAHKDDRWILSCLTLNATRNGNSLLLTADNASRLIADAPLPRSPLDTMDRLLLDITDRYRRRHLFSGEMPISTEDRRLYYLKSADDLLVALRGLERWGYAQRVQLSGDSKYLVVELTVDGWKRAAELESSVASNWQAFVAMWFDHDLDAAFTEGIKPALIQTGYQALRVDLEQHNEKIDDFIVAQLRRSGLVVADFTGNRGGVYFECGYAMGRGLPVIWCCREDHLKHVHFDTRQYNHIVWTEPGELRQRLVDRIRATLPYRDEPT